MSRGNHERALPLYEIRIQGHLAPRRLCCFEGLTVTHQPNGETVLAGPVRDQSALYGLLGWLQNIGATLLSVRRVEGGVAQSAKADDRGETEHGKDQSWTGVSSDEDDEITN